jgi:ubiquitin-protein ligase
LPGSWHIAGRLFKCVFEINTKLSFNIFCPFFHPSDPLNHEAGEQALRAESEFEEKAKKWIEKYAME